MGYGIIGAGWILPNHAIPVRALRDHDVELVAIADIDAGRARHAAAEYEALAWYTDYRELLARDDIQMVSVCLPHQAHRAVVVDAARAGKHILCEKPLALDAAEADVMIAAARAAGVTLSVIFQNRWTPGFRRMHTAIRQGAFGRILVAQAFHRCPNQTEAAFRDPWREHAASAGGGVVTMQAIHFLDVLLWCVGPVQSVTAKVHALVLERDIEDTGAAVLRFANGAIGALVTTEAATTERITRVEVHGTRGGAVWENHRWLRWEPAADYVEAAAEDGELALSEADRARLLFGTNHVRQVVDFVDRARRGLPPSVTGEDGRHATAVVQAMYESSRTGREVVVLERAEKKRWDPTSR